MHASQIHQLCLLSGRINCQGRLYHISQHVIGLTVLLDLHLSHHFWQCLPFVWNFFDVVPVLSLQNFVPLWKQKKIIQRVWKSPKKVSLWNYEPKMKKKFFRIEIVIFSNMYMNFCTKNEKKIHAEDLLAILAIYPIYVLFKHCDAVRDQWKVIFPLYFSFFSKDKRIKDSHQIRDEQNKDKRKRSRKNKVSNF